MHFTFLYGTLSLLLLNGCETKTQTGALVGGGSGAIIGGAVGGGQGALIGGAVGVIGGAVVGSALDDADRQRVEQQNPRTLNRVDNGEELSIHDIIALHASGVSDEKIIELIQKTGSHYTLNTYKIQRLKEAGVSDRVINYMMNT
ncbi:MAG: hypothetical protein KBC64_07645 [Simkaniaceae bacterium]|nr:hypothetical protein [Simkaniaceae bacterium]